LKLLFLIFIFSTSLFANTSWIEDYDEAVNIAQEQNKRIYMLIVSEDCRWCKKFERTTLKDEKLLKRLSKQYVLLHLSRDLDEIPSKFKTTPVPRHYFLSKSGEVIFPVVGYRDVDTFNNFLDTVNERVKKEKNDISTDR